MTLKVTGKINEEIVTDIQAAVEPLLVENGVDSGVVVLSKISLDRYGNIELELQQRSD